MTLEWKALKKWTLITLFCGAHSFVWGLMVDGSIGAMIAGLVTIILGFSLIESHPAYQAHRSNNALFARAMDSGIRLRLCFTGYLAVWWAISTVGNIFRMDSPILFFCALPYMAEMWIGMGANWLCKFLTGLSLDAPRIRTPYVQPTIEENFIATYLTTIFTGLLHTLILAALCGAIYLVLRRVNRNT